MDIAALLPAFGNVGFTILAFVVALSVIVFVHEYGHYIVGRLSGIYPEVFSLGFGPVLWSRADKRGTVWQVAAIPFGGYVKFRGDADAASGRDVAALSAMEQADYRTTMHGAPKWARAATLFAGPAFNFVFSIAVFAAVFMYEGKTVTPFAVGEVIEGPYTVDLEYGDVVLSVADQAWPNETGSFENFINALPKSNELPYLVERKGVQTPATGPFPQPAVVGTVIPKSAADDAGLRPGDWLVEANATPVVTFGDLKTIVEASEGADVALKIWRNGQTLDLVMAPRRVDEPTETGGFQTVWRLGVSGGVVINPATERMEPFTAIWGGVVQTGRIFEQSISGLYHVVTGAISSCNLNGPLGIAETSGSMARQGGQNFIWFIAVMSAAIGVINLFPIPVLDGGHLCMIAWETVTGKPPSDRAMQILMTLGLTVVLSFMVFALGNDLFC